MSDDSLKIQKLHSTEVKAVKPENEETKTGDVKAAEIKVGEELSKTPDSTSDVDLSKTAKKRAEQKQAEWIAAFKYMTDEYDKISEDENSVAQSTQLTLPKLTREEVIKQIRENITQTDAKFEEDYRNAQILYENRKRGTDDSLDKGLLYKMSSEKYNLNAKYSTQLKSILNKSTKLTDEELDEILKSTLLPIDNEKKQEIINFYFQRIYLQELPFKKRKSSNEKLEFFKHIRNVLPFEEFKKFYENIIINSEEYKEFKKEHPEWKFKTTSNGKYGIQRTMIAVSDYFREKKIDANADMQKNIHNVVAQRKDHIIDIESQFQEILNSEGLMSNIINSCVVFYNNNPATFVTTGIIPATINITAKLSNKDIDFNIASLGTSRINVTNAIEEEHFVLEKLQQAIKNNDIRTFFKEYKNLTGVNFEIENFTKLNNAEKQYYIAQEAQRELDIAQELEEANKHNYSWNLDSCEDHLSRPIYSPLEKALLKLTNNNPSKVLEWIKTQSQALEIEHYPTKDKYNILAYHFIKYAKTNAQNVLRERNVEDFKNEYISAIKKAYGNNIPQEKLESYIATQEIGHATLKAGIMLGMYSFGFGAIAESIAVGASMGLYELVETATAPDEFTINDFGNALQTGIKMGIYNLAFYGASQARMVSKDKILSLLNRRGISSSELIANSLSIGAGAGAMMSQDYMIAKLFNDDIDFRTELLVCLGYSILDAEFISEKMAGILDFADLSEIMKRISKKLVKSYDKSSAVKVTQTAILEIKDLSQSKKSQGSPTKDK